MNWKLWVTNVVSAIAMVVSLAAIIAVQAQTASVRKKLDASVKQQEYTNIETQRFIGRVSDLSIETQRRVNLLEAKDVIRDADTRR